MFVNKYDPSCFWSRQEYYEPTAKHYLNSPTQSTPSNESTDFQRETQLESGRNLGNIGKKEGNEQRGKTQWCQVGRRRRRRFQVESGALPLQWGQEARRGWHRHHQRHLRRSLVSHESRFVPISFTHYFTVTALRFENNEREICLVG